MAPSKVTLFTTGELTDCIRWNKNIARGQSRTQHQDLIIRPDVLCHWANYLLASIPADGTFRSVQDFNLCPAHTGCVLVAHAGPCRMSIHDQETWAVVPPITQGARLNCCGLWLHYPEIHVNFCLLYFRKASVYLDAAKQGCSFYYRANGLYHLESDWSKMMI